MAIGDEYYDPSEDMIYQETGDHKKPEPVCPADERRRRDGVVLLRIGGVLTNVSTETCQPVPCP